MLLSLQVQTGSRRALKRPKPGAVLREANLMLTDKPASQASAGEARAIFIYLYITNVGRRGQSVGTVRLRASWVHGDITAAVI